MARYISESVLKERAKRLADRRNEMMSNVDELHVKIQPGNRKTGSNSRSNSGREN